MTEGLLVADPPAHTAEPPQPVDASPPWGEAEEGLLNRLVELAIAIDGRSRESVVSLQEKLRGTASFAAVVLSLEIGAWSSFGEALGSQPLVAAGWRAAMVLLCAAVLVASCGYRPCDGRRIGSLAEWREFLLEAGATQTKVYLLENYEDLFDNTWKPLLGRQARLTVWAHGLLASGLVASVVAAIALQV